MFHASQHQIVLGLQTRFFVEKKKHKKQTFYKKHIKNSKLKDDSFHFKSLVESVYLLVSCQSIEDQ